MLLYANADEVPFGNNVDLADPLDKVVVLVF